MSLRAKLLWLVAYLLLVAGVTWGMLAVRASTIATFDNNPQAQAEWQAWRDEAQRQSDTGPIFRRVPKANEPPGLLLMRDHFPQMLVGSLFFSSVLFVLLGWTARGALAARHR